jgi:hypothetical protein
MRTPCHLLRLSAKPRDLGVERDVKLAPDRPELLRRCRNLVGTAEEPLHWAPRPALPLSCEPLLAEFV